MKPLILASSSPRRIALLESLGLQVEVAKYETDETFSDQLSVNEAVMSLALKKALNTLKHINRDEGIIIGGDTVVVLGNKILGKPKDKEDAFRMINALQGVTHNVYSGLACIDIETKQQLVHYKKTSVKMKALSEQSIWKYIETGEPMDKAGAYAIQGVGATLIERIEGDYFNVVGLSLFLLSEMLGKLGVDIF